MYLLEQLADLMPEAAVASIELIIMKILLVLPFELSRIWPWFRIEARRGCSGSTTERDRPRAFEPPEFRTASSTGQDQTTYVLIFAGICPWSTLRLLHFVVSPCTRGALTSTCPVRDGRALNRMRTVLGSISPAASRSLRIPTSGRTGTPGPCWCRRSEHWWGGSSSARRLTHEYDGADRDRRPSTTS